MKYYSNVMVFHLVYAFSKYLYEYHHPCFHFQLRQNDKTSKTCSKYKQSHLKSFCIDTNKIIRGYLNSKFTFYPSIKSLSLSILIFAFAESTFVTYDFLWIFSSYYLIISRKRQAFTYLFLIFIICGFQVQIFPALAIHNACNSKSLLFFSVKIINYVALYFNAFDQHISSDSSKNPFQFSFINLQWLNRNKNLYLYLIYPQQSFKNLIQISENSNQQLYKRSCYDQRNDRRNHIGNAHLFDTNRLGTNRFNKNHFESQNQARKEQKISVGYQDLINQSKVVPIFYRILTSKSLYICRNIKMSKLGEKRRFLQNKISELPSYQIIGNRYRVNLNPIGKGVSSIVMSGINIDTGKKVAVKKIINFLEKKHQSLRMLRQMILLRCLDHPNIVKLEQVIITDEQAKQVYLILQYMPFDIKKLFKSNQKPDQRKIIGITFQILCGLNYCGQCQVLHRDLKPENILITEDFSEVKLCDFGLARAVTNDQQYQFSKSQQKQKSKFGLSAHVTTRWYRAPQLILLQKNYTNAIDMWSVACIFGQLLGMLEKNSMAFTNRKALFPGKACYPLSPPKGQLNYQKINNFPHSVHDQLSVIFEILGTPQDISFIEDQRAKNYIKSFNKKQKIPFSKIYEYLPKHAQEFLERGLQFNPTKRMTIQQAIDHPLFDQIRGDFKLNIGIKGQPINMQLQGMSMQAIKEWALKQADHYEKIRKMKLN